MPLEPPVTSATFPGDMVFSWLSLGITNLITSRSSGKAAINFEARARDKSSAQTERSSFSNSSAAGSEDAGFCHEPPVHLDIGNPVGFAVDATPFL